MANNSRLNIFEAALQDNVEELKRHLNTGVNPDTTRDPIERRTLLHWAVVGRSVNIVRFLLNRTPQKIDYKDKDGKIPKNLCGNDPKSIEIRNLLVQYQQFLDQPVYKTSSRSQKNFCRWTTTRLQSFGSGHSIYDTIHLHLIRSSVNNSRGIKWLLDVKEIHRELSASVSEQAKNLGNDVCAALTFEISINSETHTGITIPVRVSYGSVITRSQAANERVYSRTQAEHHIGSRQRFLDLLRYYYELGFTVGGRPHCKHGHQPAYQLNESPSMKQFINHSEQALAVYLSTEAAVNYFCNALVTLLRTNDSARLGSKIRIYSITLHIHSTKTPCGACEFVLVGMMNATAETSTQFDVICMREQFQRTFTNSTQTYQFTFGKQKKSRSLSSFNLFTTFTANSADLTHRLDWEYDETDYQDSSPTFLDTRDRSNSLHVFVCRFRPFRHFVSQQKFSNLTDYTVFVSASDTNPTIPKKQQSIKRAIDTEMDQLYDGIKKLYTNTNNHYEMPSWTLDHEIPQEIIRDFERDRIRHGSELTINEIPLRLVTSLDTPGGQKIVGIPGETRNGQLIYLIIRPRGG